VSEIVEKRRHVYVTFFALDRVINKTGNVKNTLPEICIETVMSESASFDEKPSE
jgi:hypothetical protein